jgi:hypothetical protein
MRNNSRITGITFAKGTRGCGHLLARTMTLDWAKMRGSPPTEKGKSIK